MPLLMRNIFDYYPDIDEKYINYYATIDEIYNIRVSILTEEAKPTATAFAKLYAKKI